jgi:hypothetical protein
MIKAIKKYLNHRRLMRTLTLLKQLDNFLKNTGVSRQERRYFWRAMAKDEDRDKTIERIAKEAKEVLGDGG